MIMAILGRLLFVQNVDKHENGNWLRNTKFDTILGLTFSTLKHFTYFCANGVDMSRRSLKNAASDMCLTFLQTEISM